MVADSGASHPRHVHLLEFGFPFLAFLPVWPLRLNFFKCLCPGIRPKRYIVTLRWLRFLSRCGLPVFFQMSIRLKLGHYFLTYFPPAVRYGDFKVNNVILDNKPQKSAVRAPVLYIIQLRWFRRGAGRIWMNMVLIIPS